MLINLRILCVELLVCGTEMPFHSFSSDWLSASSDECAENKKKTWSPN